ncbi:arginine--tRNA ligase [Candidatus Pacearchaeota archaeon CG1_02_31_27]|nr:MAG: arginine--tRNA ligase [Candidatus Pacearchaeota archaeon CG1_02_31_27]PIN92391.1 MAG: arginine--tRNA ligase [Candidatus Pacearchaeota archaeon CG10_big_fil_rev_8_21_14_0_10_31_59]
MDFKKEVSEIIAKETKLNKEEILQIIEIPKPEFGDFAFPCFILAKEFKKSPVEISKELQNRIKLTSLFKQIKAIGPYLNFFVNKEKFSENVLNETERKHKKLNKTIVIDLSSPNIAKPFSIGHLRSTVIGYSLYKIFDYLGYKVIRDNHLGDWGTQFGKLIYAYKKWGKKEQLKKEPIKYLLELYIKFHKEDEKDEDLNEKAREEFKKLEDKNKENVKLWEEFKDLSLKEFDRIYSRLNVKFDTYLGESFYAKDIEKTVKRFSKVAKESEGALVVEVEDMPPCMLKKSDEASTYATRELATLFYREEKYKPEKILYVVGSEQTLHFKQVFSAISRIDKKLAEKCFHVPFGWMRLKEGRMSTREGKVIFMEDVLNKGKELALKLIKEKNSKLANKDEVADKISIASIVYSDLSSDRILDVEFDWDKMISFDGDTGPYLQYALVRAGKILLKEKINKIKIENLNDFEFNLVKKISLFEEIVKRSAELYKSNLIANYSYELAREFSSFYENCPVLSEKGKEKDKRLMIVKSFYETLKKCLELLNIPVLGEM